MNFFADFGFYILGGSALLFVVSLLHYKAFVEKKGKKVLVLPFFVTIGLYILLFLLGLLQGCHGESCMGMAYWFFGLPFVLAIPLCVEMIVFSLFKFFRIDNLKRFKVYCGIIIALNVLIFSIFGFAPGDEIGINARALSTKNPKICNKIIDSSSRRNTLYSREFCKLKVARSLSNFEICKSFTVPETKSVCFSSAAVYTGKGEWCNYLNGKEKENCKKQLDTARWIQDTYCSNGSTYTNCLETVCKENFGRFQHEFFYDSYQINYCLKEIAVRKNDSSVCLKSLPLEDDPRHDDKIVCMKLLSKKGF